MADQYAPKTNVTCPSNTALVRSFSANESSINPLEKDFIQLRSQKVVQSWNNWINGSDVGYNMSLFQNDFPTVAMAHSGGGLRSALFSAGVTNALDARNETSKELGTGGLYNVVQYASGSSGGTWSLASFSFANNESATIPELVKEWLLDLDLFLPASNNQQATGFLNDIVEALKAKDATGFSTTVDDIWGLLIAHHFLPGTSPANFFNDTAHGAGLLWSGLTSQDTFKSASYPFPIAVACSVSAGETANTPDDVVYEMTPLEFGSFDLALGSFANMTFVGTEFEEGKPKDSSKCVTGFDQAALVIGTSADVFDGSSASVFQTGLRILDEIIPELKTLDDNGTTQGRWQNPFLGLNLGRFKDRNSTFLNLDDGGTNNINVPIESLAVNARNVDVIVVLDASAQTTLGQENNFPNGTAMLLAANRLQTRLADNHQQLAPMPSDFAATGINLHPTFFGCDPQKNPPEFPLVIYVPNSPPCNGDDPVVNPDDSQTQYSILHQQLFLDQAFSAATCGFVVNTTDADANFPTCLKCAAIDRARLSVNPNPARSSQCQSCFDKYCFNPQNPPSAKDLPGRKFIFVDPDPQSFLHKHRVLIAVLSSVIGFLLVMTCCLITCCCIRRRRRRSFT